MHYVRRVKEVHRTEEIIHDRYDVLLGKGVVLDPSEHTAQVLIEILHYNENVIEIPIGTLVFQRNILGLGRRYHDVEELGRK